MPARRWPWFASAALLLTAALATGWSTYLHWLPCRGAMLNGSIVHGYTYGRDFGGACLRRMDGGLPFPYPPEPAEQTAWASELGVLAMILAGLAWLTVVLWSTWAALTKVIATLPGLLALGLAVNAGIAVRQPGRSPDASVPMSVWLLVEVLAVVAFIAVIDGEPVEPSGNLLPLVVAAWGSTAFGGFHMFAEYLVMSTWSDANWDVPPGTGYLTAAVLLIAGGLTLTYAVRRPGSPRPSDAAGRALADHPA